MLPILQQAGYNDYGKEIFVNPKSKIDISKKE